MQQKKLAINRKQTNEQQMTTTQWDWKENLQIIKQGKKYKMIACHGSEHVWMRVFYSWQIYVLCKFCGRIIHCVLGVFMCAQKMEQIVQQHFRVCHIYRWKSSVCFNRKRSTNGDEWLRKCDKIDGQIIQISNEIANDSFMTYRFI